MSGSKDELLAAADALAYAVELGRELVADAVESGELSPYLSDPEMKADGLVTDALERYLACKGRSRSTGTEAKEALVAYEGTDESEADDE